MIEPTDEMVQAFARVFFTNPLGEDVRAGLAAVLAIVARDHCLEAKGHVYHPLAREWPLNCGGMHPHYCASCSDGHAKGDGCINCRQTGYDQTPWPNCGACAS